MTKLTDDVDWKGICRMVIEHFEDREGTHHLPYPPYKGGYWYGPGMPSGLTHKEAEALFELVKDINEWRGSGEAK